LIKIPETKIIESQKNFGIISIPNYSDDSSGKAAVSVSQ